MLGAAPDDGDSVERAMGRQAALLREAAEILRAEHPAHGAACVFAASVLEELAEPVRPWR